MNAIELRVIKYKNGTKILQFREHSYGFSPANALGCASMKYEKSSDWKNVPIINADEPEESNI